MFSRSHFLGMLIDDIHCKTLYLNFDRFPVLDDTHVILPANSDAVGVLNSAKANDMTFEQALKELALSNAQFLHANLENKNTYLTIQRSAIKHPLPTQTGTPFLFGTHEAVLLATGFLAAYDGSVEGVYQALRKLTGNSAAGNFMRITF